MNIVFIACSPLAGAPIRIANALNKYTSYNVRCINLNPNCYGNRTFPEDLVWEKDRDECLELISQADILHFHHYFDVESEKNPFGINFKKFAPNAKIVRHFHSGLDFIIQNNTELYTAILNDKYPKLVIPHCPERSHLDAFIVPNIIPIQDELLLPKNTNNIKPQVFFSASSNTSILAERWNTKGLPQVQKKFKSLQKKFDFDFQVIQNTPYIECMQLKQNSDIVIADTTSGSYHLTDLESLSQGKPTFTYLDGRSQMVLQSLLKCDELPFINTRLEEIDTPFGEVLSNKDLRLEIGEFSRKWIEKYYNEQKLVRFYELAYEKILNDEPLKRQDCLEFKNAKTFLYNDLYDMQWKSRMEKSYKQDTRREQLSSLFQKLFSVKNEYRNGLKIKIFRFLGIKLSLKKIIKDKCDILFFVSGGLGDILIDLNYLYYLKNIINKNKAKITVVINRENVNILEAFLGENCNFVDCIYPKACFEEASNTADIVIQVSSSYPIFTLNNKTIVKNLQKKLYNLAQDNKKFRKNNSELFENFPRSIFDINKILLKQNKKRIQLPDFNNKLHVKQNFELPIPIKDEEKVLEKYNLKNCKYITLNRGVNPETKGNYSPKIWELDKYNALCKIIKEKYPHIKLVQTGVSEEKCGIMENIDINLLGKTNLEEMIIVLKNSIIHIDGEGGMVHLKNALKGKSVVLFGPTDPRIYGYNENANIRNSDFCKDCCDWADENWLVKCIKTGGKSECMNKITVEEVVNELDSLIIEL